MLWVPKTTSTHGALRSRLVAVLLGQAAADGDLHVRVGLLARHQVADVAVELVVGVLPHRAGVEHHHVGVGALGCAAVAGGFQQSGEPLGVVDVHLAAVGADLIGATGRRAGRIARLVALGQHRRHAPHRTEGVLARRNRGEVPGKVRITWVGSVTMESSGGVPMISIQGVNKHFGDLHVLKDINLDVDRGQVVVVFGPSGSGQVDPVSNDQPARDHRLGNDRDRRRDAADGGTQAGTAALRRRHGVPVVQPLRPQDDPPERHAGADEGSQGRQGTRPTTGP